MKYIQVAKFVERYGGSKVEPFDVRFMELKHIEESLLNCICGYQEYYQDYVSSQINYFLINIPKWSVLTSAKQKACLLHEIGHCITNPDNKLSGQNEMLAHKWAIELAYRRRFTAISRELLAFVERWHYNKGDSLDPHKVAAGIMISDKKWAKKYGLIV